MGKKRITKINGKILTQGGNPGDLRPDELDVNVGTDGSISITDSNGALISCKVAKQKQQVWAQTSQASPTISLYKKDSSSSTNIIQSEKGVRLPYDYNKIPFINIAPPKIIRIVNNKYNKDVTDKVLNEGSYIQYDTYNENTQENNVRDYSYTLTYNNDGLKLELGGDYNYAHMSSGNFRGGPLINSFMVYFDDGTSMKFGHEFISKVN